MLNSHRRGSSPSVGTSMSSSVSRIDWAAGGVLGLMLFRNTCSQINGLAQGA